jgi:thiamine-phosphate pyrophosphorylase
MIIVISSPVSLPGEHKIIRRLFGEGLGIFHIRKKEYSEHEMRIFIESISQEHFPKIVLHSHYHLVEEYGLRGIHTPIGFKGNVISGKTVSISFHSLEEIQKTGKYFDYGFLSPVFESISKDGYQSNFNLNEIKQFLSNRTEKIVALGGIDEDKTEITKGLGFSGIALLGAIWQSTNPLEKYKRIKEIWQKQTIVY